jgi:Ca2+-binding EF-hand superfamily protein
MYWEDSIEYNGIMKNGYVTQKELLKVLKDLDVNITIRDINLLFSEVSESNQKQ